MENIGERAQREHRSVEEYQAAIALLSSQRLLSAPWEHENVVCRPAFALFGNLSGYAFLCIERFGVVVARMKFIFLDCVYNKSR